MAVQGAAALARIQARIVCSCRSDSGGSQGREQVAHEIQREQRHRERASPASLNEAGVTPNARTVAAFTSCQCAEVHFTSIGMIITQMSKADRQC